MKTFVASRARSFFKRKPAHEKSYADPNQKPADNQLFFLTVGLVVFGILMVYNTSVVTAFREFNDKFHFAKLQAQWAWVGMISMLMTAKLPYVWWKKYAKTLLYGALILLVVVLLPHVSKEILGARRWISIGGLTIQPSEFAKLSLVVYLAHILSRSIANKLRIFLGATGVVLGLVMIEPDMGTTIVMAATALAMYWVSGANWRHFGLLFAGGAVVAMSLILVSPYRAARLWTFFDPGRDPLGSSYHVQQVLLALGSGKLSGVGWGQSRQKYEYLPEVSTDSIFAVIGEETGFIGASMVILVFLWLVLRGWQVVNHCPDQFGKLLATGIVSWLGFQAAINFSAMVVLVPLTGIPLPFISYGGSSLVVAMGSMGIVLNISKYT